MKVLISNQTKFTKYVDCDGNSKTDDTVVVGPSARRVPADVPTQKRFTELTEQYKGTLTFRKA